MIFRAVARNFAAHEENPIHDPDRVATVGWQQAAIPGAAVFGYLCQPLIATIGERWFHGFETEIRFAAPVHDGDELEILIEEDAPTLRIEGRVRGATVATMTAKPRIEEPPALIAHDRPSRRRPSIDWHKLRPGQRLTSWHWSPGIIENAEAAAQVDDQNKVYRRGFVHPHAIANVANRTLTKTFRLPHWLHVGSSISIYHPVLEKDRLEVVGSVAQTWQRRDYQFVDIAVQVTRDRDVVVAMTHRSIVNFGAPTR